MTRPVFALKYMTRFRCIADRCEDTCCAGMQIPLTPSDEARLANALGAEAQHHLTPLATPVHGCASVLTRTDDGACLLLAPGGLCSLVVRAGDDALSDACALFPRAIAQTPQRVELSGSLACPEAARLCLLAEDGTEFVGASIELVSRLEPAEFSSLPESYDALADIVRDAGLALFRDRRSPIRTRLLRLAELGARLDPFFFRGGAGDVREQLVQEIEREVSQPDALTELDGTPVIQMLFSLMSGLRSRGTARFGRLIEAVTLTYQAAALALDPTLGTAPQPSRLWSALWTALQQKHERAERVFGGRLEVLLERYWVNDLYRAPFTRSPSLAAHAFQMILRGAVLRFLALGHPVINELAASDTFTEESSRALDAAFIETVQLYAKHIEKDAEMFAMLAAHFTLESLKTDALGRARLFASAA